MTNTTAARKAASNDKKVTGQSIGGRKKSPSRESTPDFSKAFAALRKLLTPYEGRLAVRSDTPQYYYLETHTPTYKNRPMFFAAVRAGKSYVSYHLLPLYACPELLQGISPELKKRMQGKACFNFTTIDKQLFRELGRLTAAGFEKFKSLKYFG